MTGPEHYAAAQRMLSAGSYTHGPGGDPVHPEAAAHHIAMAQVHATLALAAATAAQLADRYVGDGDHINEWRTATGTAGATA
jgi:hypothetical protein